MDRRQRRKKNPEHYESTITITRLVPRSGWWPRVAAGSTALTGRISIKHRPINSHAPTRRQQVRCSRVRAPGVLWILGTLMPSIFDRRRDIRLGSALRSAAATAVGGIRRHLALSRQWRCRTAWLRPHADGRRMKTRLRRLAGTDGWASRPAPHHDATATHAATASISARPSVGRVGGADGKFEYPC